MKLINTSSLFSLLNMEFLGDKSPDSTSKNLVTPSLVNIIESIILYDDLYMLSTSMDLIKEEYKNSEDILSCFRKFELSRWEEDEINLEASTLFRKRITIPGSIYLLETYRIELLNKGIDVPRKYLQPSADWEDIESTLPEEFKTMALIIKEIFGMEFALYENICIALHRLYFYLLIQSKKSCDLILHSFIGNFIIQNQDEYAHTILDKFSKEVREPFVERKKNWLGIKKIEIKHPMIASYILKKSARWDEVLRNTLELRNSKSAALFRVGIKELTIAIKDNDNYKIDKILSALENAKNEWSKKLNTSLEAKSKITVAVPFPFVEIGTEFEVNKLSSSKSSEEKILIFIHELLKYA